MALISHLTRILFDFGAVLAMATRWASSTCTTASSPQWCMLAVLRFNKRSVREKLARLWVAVGLPAVGSSKRYCGWGVLR